MFSDVSPPRLGPLAAKLTSRTFSQAEVIFHQGDPGGQLHIVADGLVRISMVSPDGRESDIALLETGDCFGEMSVLDGGLRSATAIAVAPTKTAVLSREAFLEFLRENAELAIQIMAILVRRLRATDEMVGDIVFLDAPSRVARKLLELGRSYPATESSSGGMEVPLSQEGLARVVGCTRETVSRALATYRRLGLVATSRRRITIVRPDGLRRMFPI
jgi:CRP-like cAMP-binding protein